MFYFNFNNNYIFILMINDCRYIFFKLSEQNKSINDKNINYERIF